MFLVHAKDDGLGKAVGLFQDIGLVTGNRLSTGSQRDQSLKSVSLILLVGNHAAITVEVVLGIE
jgi:hypothetical protein